MLPPLRSTSGSGSSFQNHSSLASGTHQAAQATYTVQVVDWKGDSNSSSAGKLNVLLLAGRERIADHLSMLADAVGKAINLPRREGEGSGDYILRLAEAVSRLGPRQRADVERQLNLVLQGLKLRFLFEAFSNPAGPQAARIVAYMETARYKDRDLAARSVVTSYRQNDGGEGNGNTSASPGPAPGQTAQAAAQKNPEPLNRQTPAEPPLPEAARPSAQPETGETGSASATAEPAMKAEEAENPAAPETDADTGAETLSAAAAGEGEPAETDDGIDARSLQTLLRRAFEGGDNGDATIEAKATAELLAVEEDRRPPADPMDEPLPFEDADLAGYEMEDADPAEHRAPEGNRPQRAWGGETPASTRPLAGRTSPPQIARLQIMPETQVAERPSPAAEARTGSILSAGTSAIARAPSPAAKASFEPTLFTLKGWIETEVEAKDIAMAYEAIIEDGEEAQTLLRKAVAEADGEAATSANQNGPQPDIGSEDWRPSLLRPQPKGGETQQPAAPQAEAHAGDMPAGDMPGNETDPIYDPLTATGHTAQEAEDTLPARDAARPSEKTASETAQQKATPPAVIERQALAQLLPVARDMVPMALAPVSLRDDEFAEETQLEGRPFRRDEDAQEDSGEQDGRRQDAREDTTAGDEMVADEDGDAAYELYQRMANWA